MTLACHVWLAKSQVLEPRFRVVIVVYQTLLPLDGC